MFSLQPPRYIPTLPAGVSFIGVRFRVEVPLRPSFGLAGADLSFDVIASNLSI